MENECEESSEEESIFSYFIEVDLKEYSQSMANNLEDSPYAYLPTKDGNNQRVVQKSAIVLFAEAGVRRLGNDRISRVIQTATLPERKKNKSEKRSENKLYMLGIGGCLKMLRRIIIIWESSKSKSCKGMGRQ